MDCSPFGKVGMDPELPEVSLDLHSVSGVFGSEHRYRLVEGDFTGGEMLVGASSGRVTASFDNTQYVSASGFWERW